MRSGVGDVDFPSGRKETGTKRAHALTHYLGQSSKERCKFQIRGLKKDEPGPGPNPPPKQNRGTKR